MFRSLIRTEGCRKLGLASGASPPLPGAGETIATPPCSLMLRREMNRARWLTLHPGFHVLEQGTMRILGISEVVPGLNPTASLRSFPQRRFREPGPQRLERRTAVAIRPREAVASPPLEAASTSSRGIVKALNRAALPRPPSPLNLSLSPSSRPPPRCNTSNRVRRPRRQSTPARPGST